MRRASLGLAAAAALAAGACSSPPRPQEPCDLAKYAPFVQSGVTHKTEVFERFGRPQSAYEADRVYVWAATVDSQRGLRIWAAPHAAPETRFILPNGSSEVVIEFDAADVVRRGSLIHATEQSGWARLR